MENAPSGSFIERKIDVTPSFDLTSPKVSKEFVQTLFEVEKNRLGNSDAVTIISEQEARIVSLFDNEENDEGALRAKLLKRTSERLENTDLSKEERIEALSDRHFLSSTFDKIDSWRNPLTGLYNRKGFVEVMKLATQYPKIIFGQNYDQVMSKDFSVMMMDLDYFKEVNDTLGHPAGDRALKEFAGAITRVVRPTDICVHYGGEEMFILALGADQNDASIVDARISERLKQVKIKEGDMEKTIEYSAGVDNGKTWDDIRKITDSDFPMDVLPDFISNADKALYKAKNMGRNQMVIYEY
jgi:diguanylate cyclase (GGDEF)-like protein